MKAKIALIALAMAVAAPTWAAESQDPIGDLSQITGLSERKVQMLLGNRTAFAEYPYTYDRAYKKFVGVVGKDAYDSLLNGGSVALRDQQGNEYIVRVTSEDLKPSM